MDSIKDVWNAVTDILKADMSATAFDMWIGCIEPRDIEESSFVVFVNNSFQRKVIENKYRTAICEALEQVMQFPMDLKILCNEIVEEDAPLAVSGSNDEFTFDTFVVGEDNKFAYAAAQSVAENPAVNYNPLFIYGASGLGKTHLLYAIRHELFKNHPETNVVYVTCETFIDEFVDSVHKKDLTEFKEKYRDADVLLVDDIQFLSRKEETQNEFFYTFDALERNHKQIVMTSDRPPKEISTLTDRLRSRFEQGLLADIKAPDLETRMVIIKSKANQVGLSLSNEICEYIANQLKTNVRQLEGVVKNMKAHLLLTGEKPSIAVAQSAIVEVKSSSNRKVSVQDIINEVCRSLNVTPDQVMSKDQTADVSYARQTVVKIIRLLMGLSYKAIGKELGRHHTTIMHCEDVANDNLKKDSSYRDLIEDICKNLQSME